MRIALLYCISMNIQEYLEAKKITQSSFADLAGVSLGMVNHWIKGRSPVSPELSVVIENKTSGMVSRKDLHPDNWMNIWPELKDVA